MRKLDSTLPVIVTTFGVVFTAIHVLFRIRRPDVFDEEFLLRATTTAVLSLAVWLAFGVFCPSAYRNIRASHIVKNPCPI